MPMIVEVITRVESIRLLAKQKAMEIAEENKAILSISLAGSWALGIPSPNDVDLVIVFRNDSPVIYFDQHKMVLASGNKVDLHCYSAWQNDRMFKRKTSLPIVKSARFATRKLRKYPFIKKVLIKCLGQGISFFKSHEITTQANQILIPLVDRDDYFVNLQKKQRNQLEQELTKCEMILHQPDGFYLLLESYLTNTFSQQELRPVLLNFYGNSKEFLQRAIQCYDTDSAIRLVDLYKYIYGTLPISSAQQL